MNAALADLINPNNYVDEEEEEKETDLINSKLAQIIEKQINELYTPQDEKEYVETKAKSIKGFKNSIKTATNDFIKSKEDQH